MDSRGPGMNRYRRDREDVVLPCVLDDVVLLYHRASGQTHMVISPVPEIFEALADGAPADARGVHARLASSFDMGPDEDAVAAIDAHLAHLSALGLVRAA